MKGGGAKLSTPMKISPLSIAVLAATLAVEPSGRILTPNGDSINDTVAFHLPHPAAGSLQAAVYDVRGRRVSGLAAVSPTRFQWDGRNTSGQVVESGVYLVQISEDSALWNGLVAVAR